MITCLNLLLIFMLFLFLLILCLRCNLVLLIQLLLSNLLFFLEVLHVCRLCLLITVTLLRNLLCLSCLNKLLTPILLGSYLSIRVLYFRTVYYGLVFDQALVFKHSALVLSGLNWVGEHLVCLLKNCRLGRRLDWQHLSRGVVILEFF